MPKKYIVTSDRIEAQEHTDKEKADLDFAYRKFFDKDATMNEIVEVEGTDNGQTAEESQSKNP